MCDIANSSVYQLVRSSYSLHSAYMVDMSDSTGAGQSEPHSDMLNSDLSINSGYI